MPKNKNKPNAFLYFMLEWKEGEEKKGRSFPNGLKDVQIDPTCNGIWQNMSEQDKAKYKQIVKNNKEKPHIEKRTGLGESVKYLEKLKIQEQVFKDNMIEYITGLINDIKGRDGVQKLQFYVIHVNYFYSRVIENDKVEYYPAEIAIIEFSLEKGIIRTYHQIVNEKIAMGFTAAAKEHSINTHHIPLNAPFGKSNYQEIFKDICKFLEPGKINGKLPPLYTSYSAQNVYYPVKSVLSKLLIAANKPDDYLLLYSFEDLFASIHNAIIEQTGGNKIEPIIATMELKKDPFAYKLGLECEYHGDLTVGLVYCSQSYVKRWLFVLCNYCCEPLGISMIPGVHMPKENVKSNFSVESFNSSFNNLSLNESRKTNSTISGISSIYRQRILQRSMKDKEHNKLAADSESLEIIDHSKINTTFKKPQEPIERPLRAPYTKSAVAYFDTTDTESIDFSEDNFPSVGRGSIMKKKINENKNSVGQSYAARLKS